MIVRKFNLLGAWFTRFRHSILNIMMSGGLRLCKITNIQIWLDHSVWIWYWIFLESRICFYVGQSKEASRFAPHSVGDQPTHAAQNLRIFENFWEKEWFGFSCSFSPMSQRASFSYRTNIYYIIIPFSRKLLSIS